jgi:PAS domain S-box-containing protein
VSFSDQKIQPALDASTAARPSTDVDGAVADLGAQLRDLEIRYRGILDGLPAVIYLVNVGPDALVCDVSPGVDALLGISREEWLARPHAWVDRVHPDDRERVTSAVDRAAQTGDPFHVEYRAIHRDGREVWIKEDCVLIRDEHGTPTYWLGLMLDVTDDAAMRGQLHEVRSQYGALVEQIPAIVYVDIADE